ncbi:nitrogenase component 1 [Acetonema longum]|uniref:Nitrogenase n=1 Tax=Acetonema longum DSM 6540 TaxID=1009370 RepID=F7NPZ7_9FIRM|nr:nitrogenase component 1 [Acetonema longum]EGO61874.1 nitrogenase [Acetonema longum DSM 6540]
MDYIKEKTPPVREDRLRVCNAYGGSCPVLVKQSRKGCINGLRRSFSQTQGCQLNLSLASLNTFRDTVIIVHGPVGCGGSNVSSAGSVKTFKKLRDPQAQGLIWLSTNLGEADVIRGGETAVQEAVFYAEQEFRPEIIMVVNSCVPALIGDDLDGLLAELQPQVHARLAPVHCEGFKSRIMASAYDAVYHGILRNLTAPPERDKSVILDETEEFRCKLRKSRTVNLLNVSSMSRADELELSRLLQALGLTVNILPHFAHPEQFKEATEAALNISICATHDDYFVEHLRDLFGIPFILNTIPIGVKNTNKWILDIAGHFGLEEQAKQLISRENAELEEAIAPFRPQFQGKRVLACAGEIRVIATAEMLQYLGMEVIGLRAYHYDQFADNLLDDLANREKIPINVATGQPFEQANLIEKLKPDVYLGHVNNNGWAARHGLPVLPIFQQSNNYMGYNGTFEVARRLARILRNPAFNRNLSQNNDQPYFDHWFKEEPFSYIDGNVILEGDR